MRRIDIIKNTLGKWESFGFLEGLHGEEKEKVAKAYDLLASYMLNNELKMQDNIECFLFPILRRVLTECPECNFNNPADFVEYVTDYKSYYMPYYESKRKNGVNIDPEAQCCYECVEQIKAILKAREEDNGQVQSKTI